MLSNVVTDLFLAEVCKYKLAFYIFSVFTILQWTFSVYIYIFSVSKLLYNVWISALGTQQTC